MRFSYTNILVALCFLSQLIKAQNVGINATNSSPHISAGLDIDFTNKGILIPRVALIAKNSTTPIGTIATGLMVYNTATSGSSPNNVIPGFYWWNGTTWISFGGSGGFDWSLTGNSGLTAGTNFLGTSDATDLVFKTNNTETFRANSTNNNLLIGTTTLNTAKLNVNANNVTNSIGEHIISNSATSYLTNTTNGGGLFVTSANTGVAITGGNFNGTNADRLGYIGGKFTAANDGYGVFGQAVGGAASTVNAPTYGFLGYKNGNTQGGAYGQADFSLNATNPAVSYGWLGLRDQSVNRSYGVYGYAPANVTSSTWSDGFETNTGWTLTAGNGFATIGTPMLTDCVGACAGFPTTAYAGSNCLNLRNCNSNSATNSYATINLNLTSAGVFSGYYVASREGCCDHLQYKIDAGAWTTLSNITACQTAWTYFSFAVPAGAHSISLGYYTDGSVISNGSKVWVDNVSCTNVGTYLHYAGYFAGNASVTGNLTKGSGSFLIDHPDDPENKTLKHDFVESPFAINIYPGKIKLNSEGNAQVKLPDYFKSLNKEDEAVVLITPIGKKPFLTSYEWNEDHTSFVIYGTPESEVAYQVNAQRDDPTYNYLKKPVEEFKGTGNTLKKGIYILPEAYGVSSKSDSNKLENSAVNETILNTQKKESNYMLASPNNNSEIKEHKVENSKK